MAAAAPPALDPRPTLRELDRARRVVFVVITPLLLIAAAFLYFAWNDAWMYGQDAVRHTQAEVVDRWFVPGPDRWWVRYTFADAAGATHTVEHSLDEPPEHDVGDRIDIVHWTNTFYGEVEMDTVSRGDLLGKRIFHGMAAITGGTAGLLLATFLRNQGWRRRLLREGERIAGTHPALERRTLVIGPVIDQWRLTLRHYDPQTFAWTESRSDWHADPPPTLVDGMALPPILRDPRRPRRTWIPAAGLAPPK